MKKLNANIPRFVLVLVICLVWSPLSSNGQADPGEPLEVVILETKLKAIFGGVRDGKLIKAKTAEASLSASDSFKYFGLSGTNGNELKLNGNEKPSGPCEEFYSYDSVDEPKAGIAFSSNLTWDPVPRAIQKISTTSRVYKNIVSGVLKKKGIAKPVVKIQQAYRVDLEGDGQDEVVIRAEHYANFGPGTRNGDYSLVLLRKIVGKSVRNILVAGEFYPKAIEFGAPNRQEISSIADLDGDGTMEIVIYGSYYEGIWAEAYSINNGKAEKVLETGCGV